MSRQIGDRRRRLRYDGTSVSNGDMEIGEVEMPFSKAPIGLEASSAVMMVIGHSTYEWKKGLEADCKTSTKSRYGLK